MAFSTVNWVRPKVSYRKWLCVSQEVISVSTGIDHGLKLVVFLESSYERHVPHPRPLGINAQCVHVHGSPASLLLIRMPPTSQSPIHLSFSLAIWQSAVTAVKFGGYLGHR